jgi:ABC-type transport system substrate-binding protein/class 3 adenylate cyclase
MRMLMSSGSRATNFEVRRAKVWIRRYNSAMGVTAGERRIVTVLVADVVGSTPIAERLGPERSKHLFDEVIRLMRQEVERLGGTVLQLTGDGMLALFGAPTAHEDDAERAVRAALAIHEALERYDADVGAAYGIELAARVAVNTGTVVVLEGDEPPEQRYNALGDTVNVAARLEGAAQRGHVCVGEATARQLGDTFELDPLGGLKLKGKSVPVNAFLVRGVREVERSKPPAPLVGRKRELQELAEVFDTLVDGGGAVVSVTGEPGIGKSRLLAELRSLYGDRVRFLEGRAVAEAEGTPYWPVRGLIRDWLGLGISDPEARVRLELRAALSGSLGVDADAAYPFLAALLGLPVEGEAAQQLRDLSRDSVQRQAVEWFVGLVRGLARRRPVCLVLEDLHWADEATLALLGELLPAVDDDAIAVVLVHRSDPDHAAWHLVDEARRRYRHRFGELDLAPLQPQAARELAEIEAGAALPSSVGELLVQRSGGNPFFLEEALRDLLERGALRRHDGQVSLVTGLHGLSIPAVVQEALQARLGRLGRATREVLAAASVAGVSFDLPLLERVLGREQLSSALAELQRLDLVVEERRQPVREYRFRHGLVQEVTYASLVDSQRARLHGRIGEALEEIHRDSLEEVYGALARHFSEADEPRRAADYLLKAGDAARMVYADDEALEHYRRALEFLDRLEDHESAREALFKIGLTHHLAFDFGRAQRAYANAFSRPTERRESAAPSERIETAHWPVRDLAPSHAQQGSDSELIDLLFRGLVRLGRDLNVVPDVADTFEVSADGQAYRFRIRTDSRWSDGEPVTAHDFVATWETVRYERTPYSFLLDELEAAAADDRTLDVRLREPRNYLLYVLAGTHLFPWPRHKLQELGDNWRQPQNIVGNGPFTIAEVDDEHLILVVNPFWTGPRGNVGEIHVALSTNVSALVDQWGRGDFDVLAVTRPLEPSDAWRAELVTSLEMDYLAFNASVPPFDDGAVRRAFAHGLDRDALMAAAGDDLDQPAGRGGAIPPALLGHSHRVTPEFDAELAQRLLAAAGYPDGRGLPVIRVVIPSPSGEYRHRVECLAAELAAQWSRLGARLDTMLAPGMEWLDAVTAGANVWMQGWQADYPDPDGFLRTILRVTPWLYRDERLERLLERARSLRDQNERIRLYQEFERRWLGEEAALVPLAYDRWLLLRRPWIEGLWGAPLPRGMLDDVVVQPELKP